MTTIAVRGKVMASDSQSTHNDLRTWGEKLFKKNGLIIGVCGDLSHAALFVDWLEDQKQRKPDLSQEGEFEALVMQPNGIVTWWNVSLRPLIVREEFYAIGSGCHLAIGAMEAGCSAKQAVEIACRRDPSSALPVRTMRFK